MLRIAGDSLSGGFMVGLRRTLGAQGLLVAALIVALGALGAADSLAAERCRCTSAGGNLVENGDFEAGDRGFTSDARPGRSGAESDHYWVTDSANFHSAWSGRGNPGKFLLVDSPSPRVAWRQTVRNIVPGQRYCFSVDVTDVGSRYARPVLQLQVDGSALHSPETLQTGQGEWVSWSWAWRAPARSRSSVTLSIVAVSVESRGHDFGIDNVRFTPCCDGRAAPDPRFEVRLPRCPGGEVIAQAARGEQGRASEHRWRVTRSTADGTPLGETRTVCAGPQCELPLEGGACYRVSHAAYGSCHQWVEESKVVCLPSALGVDRRDASPELCERIRCEPGEVFVDNECGCGCVALPGLCPPSLADAGPDRVVCPGSRDSDVTLGEPGEASCSYRWLPAEGLSDASAAEPQVLGRRDGRSTRYTVQAKCENGCGGEDTVTVRAGAEAGLLRQVPGRDAGLACGSQASLEVVGHSADALEWECAESLDGRWQRCSGADRSRSTYTTQRLRGPLFVRVRAACGRSATDVSNVLALDPFCVRGPRGGWLPVSATPAGGVVYDLPEGSVQGPVPEDPRPGGPIPGTPSSPDGPGWDGDPPRGGDGDGDIARATIRSCSPLVASGQTMCACGRFPDRRAQEGLRLGWFPLEPEEASPSRLLVRVPEPVEPGSYQLRGDARAGFDEATCSFQVVGVETDLDRDELYRDRGTTLELRIRGTTDRVRVRLDNTTPRNIALEGGDQQVLTSSGGEYNRIQRRVRGLRQGPFEINWTLLDTECPCR